MSSDMELATAVSNRLRELRGTFRKVFDGYGGNIATITGMSYRETASKLLIDRHQLAAMAMAEVMDSGDYDTDDLVRGICVLLNEAYATGEYEGFVKARTRLSEAAKSLEFEE